MMIPNSIPSGWWCLPIRKASRSSSVQRAVLARQTKKKAPSSDGAFFVYGADRGSGSEVSSDRGSGCGSGVGSGAVSDDML